MAAFGLVAVNNPRAVNPRIDIGDPASYTWTQIAAVAGQGLGIDLPLQYLPLGSEAPLLPPAASGRSP